MRLFNRFMFALILLPLLVGANSLDATYKNVSMGCYLAFKTTFSMLPDYAEDFGFGISHMKTPSGNPSTFSLTVDYSPSGNGVGDYKLHQKYSNNHLYLRLDQYPDTFPIENVDELWTTIDNLLKTCPFSLQTESPL